MHPYLSGTAAKTHIDERGEEHIEANSTAYSKLPTKFDTTSGTVAFSVEKEAALGCYVSLVEKLKTGPEDADGLPKFVLDTAGRWRQPWVFKKVGWVRFVL